MTLLLSSHRFRSVLLACSDDPTCFFVRNDCRMSTLALEFNVICLASHELMASVFCWAKPRAKLVRIKMRYPINTIMATIKPDRNFSFLISLRAKNKIFLLHYLTFCKTTRNCLIRSSILSGSSTTSRTVWWYKAVIAHSFALSASDGIVVGLLPRKPSLY